jgi:hypothetical protein
VVENMVTVPEVGGVKLLTESPGVGIRRHKVNAERVAT